MRNLRAVDLNLLPVFEALYEERSSSRAARRLAMTQPAVSQALSRLRTLFRDDLFVRQSRGMIPTRVADRLYEGARRGLESIRDMVDEAREFDPRTSDRSFAVAITHPLGAMIAIRLRQRLSRSAPNMRASFNTHSMPVDLLGDIKSNRVDLAIDWLAPSDGRFRVEELFRDGLVAVARDGHPALRGGTRIEDLRKLEFVALSPRSGSESPIPGVRQFQRLKLDIVLEVAEVTEMLMVAHQSDLCALIPVTMHRMAEKVMRLRVLPCSPKPEHVPVMLIWHASRDGDRAHEFVRKELVLAATNEGQPLTA
jgi:DNA-binding transcriptional LysR family regulator